MSDDGARRPPARPAWAVALAWTVFGLEMVAFAIGAWFHVRNGVRSSFEVGPLDGLIFLTFPVAGVVLATKLPRNPLGWLMLGIGTFMVSPGAAYARYATITHDGDLPGAGLALALHAPGWVLFIGLAGFLLLLFPDGHVPTPRWRPVAWACGIGLVALYATSYFLPGAAADYEIPDAVSPLAIEALGAERAVGAGVRLLAAFAPLTVVVGAVAVIRRLRRSVDPVERQQLRWLAWAAGVIATLYVAAAILSIAGAPQGVRDAADAVASTSFALIPITIGIAVLRFRLFDIDFVIRKTVVLTVMVAAIAAVYGGIVAGIGALVGETGSPLLSAVAAAVVAIAFHPLRARARRFADRLVYGRRATPYEVMAAFGEQLAGGYASDDVLGRTAAVLGEGIGAIRTRVLLRVDEGLEEVARWPAHAPPGDDGFLADVRHQGETLGALAVVMPPNDPMDPSKERLLRDFAAQAGLVLRNERLTASLRARLVELQAAQKRLVSAQDHERRRLERNIHDGAQQQLVALAVKTRLARSFTDRDPAKANEMLVQVEAETQQALDDLRDLARGIYPPLLADRGLAAAIESQARRATVPVSLRGGDVGRYPADVESAVYFSVLEALQNVAKYAGASSVEVTLVREPGGIAFTVRDDGRGFDPGSTGYGTGLQGIADRLGALDGALTVDSSPGSGTTVRGRVPAEASDPTASPPEDPSSVERLTATGSSGERR